MTTGIFVVFSKIKSEPRAIINSNQDDIARLRGNNLVIILSTDNDILEHD